MSPSLIAFSTSFMLLMMSDCTLAWYESFFGSGTVLSSTGKPSDNHLGNPPSRMDTFLCPNAYKLVNCMYEDWKTCFKHPP